MAEVGQVQESIGLLSTKLQEAQTAHQVTSPPPPPPRLPGPLEEQGEVGARPRHQGQLPGYRQTEVPRPAPGLPLQSHGVTRVCLGSVSLSRSKEDLQLVSQSTKLNQL